MAGHKEVVIIVSTERDYRPSLKARFMEQTYVRVLKRRGTGEGPRLLGM